MRRIQSQNVYVLRTEIYVEGSEDNTYCAQFDEIDTGPAPRCLACGEFIGALTWLPPFDVEIELSGRDYGDFVPGVGGDQFVSAKLKHLIEANGIKGFTGFDLVHVTRVRRMVKQATHESPPRYFRVSIVRSNAAIDLSASGFEWEAPPTCDACRLGSVKRWRRVIFEEDTLGDEDVFIARGLAGTVFASARFRDLCLRQNVRNAVFTPAHEYAVDFYPDEKGGSRWRKRHRGSR